VSERTINQDVFRYKVLIWSCNIRGIIIVWSSGEKSEAGASSGLGLAIARQAVLAHNGIIYANNSPEGGLSVTIKLPIDRDANLGDIKVFCL
jgi:hypothetical protein